MFFSEADRRGLVIHLLSLLGLDGYLDDHLLTVIFGYHFIGRGQGSVKQCEGWFVKRVPVNRSWQRS